MPEAHLQLLWIVRTSPSLPLSQIWLINVDYCGIMCTVQARVSSLESFQETPWNCHDNFGPPKKLVQEANFFTEYWFVFRELVFPQP